MVEIHQSAYQQLRRHAKATYPNECCGILLGLSSPAGSTVTQAVPAPNASQTPWNQYQIHPRDLIRLQKTALLFAEEILGFYHSHPNHPAAPSPTDLSEAHWLGCCYMITSVRHGEVAETRSFALAGTCEEDKHFVPEEVVIVPPALS